MIDNQASDRIDLSQLPGILVVISGPAASGKNTLANALLEEEGMRLWESVSDTTRDLRPGESDGEHYNKLSRPEFLAKVEAGYFLEHAEFGSNLYGTPAAPVIEHLKQGINVLIIAEVQGAAQIRRRVSDALTIFVMPAGDTQAEQEQHLRQRLAKRGTESAEQIEGRLAIAFSREIPQALSYQHRVVNRDGQLESTVHELHTIVEDARARHAARLAAA